MELQNSAIQQENMRESFAGRKKPVNNKTTVLEDKVEEINYAKKLIMNK